MTSDRLPLFPLNTVLMPGMVLPLHIFEPRYRLMMQQVLAGERRFGVLLIKQGVDVGGQAEPFEVGTVAQVTAVVPLEDGRMNISTTGGRRFRVQRFYDDQAYLTADVEYLPEQYTASERLQELQEEVERLCTEYVATILTLREEHADQVSFPSDPVTLSYKVAGLLVALQPFEAQDLLASPTVEHRLFAEIGLLRREMAILRRMAEMTDNSDSGRICPN